MRTFKSHTNEGRVTPALVKGLGFMLRNKLSQRIKSGKTSKDLSQKLDALLDAQGIIGSIGIMNIGMEDGGQSLMSRSIIIRGLINELHQETPLRKTPRGLHLQRTEILYWKTYIHYSVFQNSQRMVD